LKERARKGGPGGGVFVSVESQNIHKGTPTKKKKKEKGRLGEQGKREGLNCRKVPRRQEVATSDQEKKKGSRLLRKTKGGGWVWEEKQKTSTV